MKLLGLVVAMFALCMFVGTSFAKEAGAGKGNRAAKADVVAGKISAAADAQGKIKVTKRAKDAAAAEEITVATDANTVVTIDGAAGKVSDLQVGMVVKISPATGTATKIEATSKKPAARKNNK